MRNFLTENMRVVRRLLVGEEAVTLRLIADLLKDGVEVHRAKVSVSSDRISMVFVFISGNDETSSLGQSITATPSSGLKKTIKSIDESIDLDDGVILFSCNDGELTGFVPGFTVESMFECVIDFIDNLYDDISPRFDDDEVIRGILSCIPNNSGELIRKYLLDGSASGGLHHDRIRYLVSHDTFKNHEGFRLVVFDGYQDPLMIRINGVVDSIRQEIISKTDGDYSIIISKSDEIDNIIDLALF